MEEKERTMEELLRQYGVGVRPINDSFFDESYEVCKVFQRKGIIIDDDEESFHEVLEEFPCNVPSCKTTFQTILDYEMHYNSTHRYVCMECKVSRPNPRLLEIHIQETHDAFFEVSSEKLAMYQCYDSECDIKFNNPIERRQHCIEIHKFPKRFRFDDTFHDNRNNSSNTTDKMEVDDDDSKDDSKKKKKAPFKRLDKNQKSKMFTKSCASAACANNITAEPIPSTSSNKSTTTPLAFIPRQVQKSFSKALTNNQNRERNVLESESIMELADSLPD